MNLIGLDFSINKPGACVYHKGEYIFYGWPYSLTKSTPAIYESAGVHIIKRTDDKIKGNDVSAQMRYQVENASYLATLMFDTLEPYLNEDTMIAYEGMSYGSSGDVILQLGGYKYMIMDKLSEMVPLANMFTYSPITVKKTAGCSKRGLGKHAVIDAFILESAPNKLRDSIRVSKDVFMKKGGKNYIDHLDDLVDAYWVLETLREKEGL